MTTEKSSALWLSTAIAVGVTLALSVTGQAQDLKVCKSTFALCTIAQCDAIPGNDKQVSCHCTVNTRYSTGAEPCSGVKNTPEGRQIHSRYYPVKSYRAAQMIGLGHGAWISPALSTTTILKRLRARATW
jgi:hypothetical protein